MTWGKGRKFKAKWTKDAEGGNHPSGGEAKGFDMMRLRERAGEIFNLKASPRFDVYVAKDCPHCRAHGTYVGHVKADWEYDDADGVHHIEDWKEREGETALSRFKRRFVLAGFGIEIKLVGPGAKQAAQIKLGRKAKKAPVADLLET